MNHYFTSDGERVTEDQIKRRLRVAYESDVNYVPICEGCEVAPVESHAHIIPKARCKQLRRTELIWTSENWFYGCNKCNAIAENVSSPAILQLRNLNQIKFMLKAYDYERYQKLMETIKRGVF